MVAASPTKSILSSFGQAPLEYIYFLLVLTPLAGLVSSASSAVGAAFSLAAAFALALAAVLLAEGVTFALGNGIARDRDSRIKASCTLSWMVDDGDLNSGGWG